MKGKTLKKEGSPRMETKIRKGKGTIFPVTARAGGASRPGGGGGLPTGGQCYVRSRPGGIGFPAGRIGDWGDREIVYVASVYVPFPAPKKSRNSPPPPKKAKEGQGSGILNVSY